MKSEEDYKPSKPYTGTLTSPASPTIQLPTLNPQPKRFNDTARTDEEIHAALRRISQESRPTDPVALGKLRVRATIGIDPPFTFLDLDNSDLTLQHTYNVSMRIQSFEYILTQYDMIDAFRIHLFQPNVEPPMLLEDSTGAPIFINLLTHHSSLTEEQVV